MTVCSIFKKKILYCTLLSTLLKGLSEMYNEFYIRKI